MSRPHQLFWIVLLGAFAILSILEVDKPISAPAVVPPPAPFIGPLPSTTTTSTSTSTTSTTTTVEPDYDLKLNSFNCSSDNGFFRIEGTVTNISINDYQHVKAVGLIFDKDSEFLKSESVYVEYAPLRSGETTPFRVLTTDHPASNSCRVEFATSRGEKLLTKYPAPKTTTTKPKGKK